MQEKPMYTLRELFDDLPISLRQLGKRANVNEVTIARIRDGQPARRSTLNRLLRAMSETDVYNRSLSLANVTGVFIQGETKPDEAEYEIPSEDLPLAS
jgi:predicted transcriptional regulator